MEAEEKRADGDESDVLPPLLQVREHPQRASRVLLDIEAGAPVILIPESSCSPRVVVANLGQLKVQNCFLSAGAQGTFSLKDKVEKLTMAHAFFPSLVSPGAVRALLVFPAPNSAVFIGNQTMLLPVTISMTNICSWFTHQSIMCRKHL